MWPSADRPLFTNPSSTCRWRDANFWEHNSTFLTLKEFHIVIRDWDYGVIWLQHQHIYMSTAVRLSSSKKKHGACKFSQPFKKKMIEWCSEKWLFHLSNYLLPNSPYCMIYLWWETERENWSWSLLGVKRLSGLTAVHHAFCKFIHCKVLTGCSCSQKTTLYKFPSHVFAPENNPVSCKELPWMPEVF